MQSDKKICGYCQSAIKNNSDVFYCPGCKTPYHPDCWEESEGCAVYGCTYQSGNHSIEVSAEHNIEDLYVNIEYLINERRYTEAITETKRILDSDRENIKAKRFYNYAVSLINSKTRLLNDADTAFNNGDYKGAEVYYGNSIQFLSDDERKVVNAKMQWIRERIPLERRRKRIGNFVTVALVILIFGAIVYGGYYYIVLEEDRAYAEIEKKDNFEDVKMMEMQLSEYTRFALKYRDGRNYDKASDKVSLISGILADSLSGSDWKEAIKFLKKVDKDRNAKTYSDVYGKIYKTAEKEFKTVVSNAKKLNSMKRYVEAKNMTEQALEIIDEFPGSDMEEHEKRLDENIGILTRKISTMLKYDNIESEIEQKQEELSKYGVFDPKLGGNPILNVTIEENLGNGVWMGKLSDKGTLVALKPEAGGFMVGEYISIEAKRTGSIDLELSDGKNVTVPMYTTVKTDVGMAELSSDRFARESLQQRLEYLRSQKTKLDSILAVKLL
jgi:tetratricopeptide (TPR) repeat protein